MTGIPFTSATLAIICSTYILLQERECATNCDVVLHPTDNNGDKKVYLVCNTLAASTSPHLALRLPRRLPQFQANVAVHEEG